MQKTILLPLSLSFLQCHKDNKASPEPETIYNYIQESIKPFEVKTNS
jgi:hypothetical protein